MHHNAPKPPNLAKHIGGKVNKTTHLVAQTKLVRVYSQPAGVARRDTAFNPLSNGRASPVVDAVGRADPAMYVAVDSPQGAAMEMLHHAFIKQYPMGAVVSRAKFADIRLAYLKLQVPVDLISVEALQNQQVLAPATFSAPRSDYTDTQAVAQQLYDLCPQAAGIAWHSARGNSVVAALYQSRLPKNALKVVGKPVALLDSEVCDFVLALLGHHNIIVQY